MNLFITIFLYFSFLFLVLFSFWTFMSFFVTRSRYRTTRILKRSDNDLESIRQQMRRTKKSIVLEGDISEKSIFLLRKAFDKIKKGMINKNINNDNIKTVNNINDKEELAKESNNKSKESNNS